MSIFSSWSNQHNRVLFYGFWILSQLIFASSIELIADEAYYWLYAQNLDWGYFDHPPMIAALIWFGTQVFDGEIGVRIIGVILGAASIFLWEKIIRPKNLVLFYLLVVGSAILHFTTLYALPDAPFMFFVSLFLWLLKRYYQTRKEGLLILLGVIGGLMVYSKYHAFLFLAIVVFTNLHLLNKKQLWLGIALALMMLAPHFIWQYENGFPSITYHLLGRNKSAQSLRFVSEYITAAPLVLGPITSLFFWFATLATNTQKHTFDRTMKALFIVPYLFFFIMALKGRVEMHWVLFTLIPGLYFSYFWVQEKRVLRKVLLVSSSLLVALILLAKGVLALRQYEWLTPFGKQIQLAYFDKTKLANTIFKAAQHKPVAFVNSYKRASFYSYYSGGEGFSHNSVTGRRNQFTIWNAEEEYRDLPVILETTYPEKASIKYEEPFEFFLTEVEHYQAFTSLRIEPQNMPFRMISGEEYKVNLLFSLPRGYQMINCETYLVRCLFMQNDQVKINELLFKVDDSLLDSSQSVVIKTPQKKGVYQVVFSVRSGLAPETPNSKYYEVIVE